METLWPPDVLGDGYEATELPFGNDPDGSAVVATVVRHQGGRPAGRAVLYVHGFNDYFFQRHLAEHFAAHGWAFYAVDLRRCGRSRRPPQPPHYTTDLAEYDADLDGALAVVRAGGHDRVAVLGHSTGGLITPLWLDRRGGRDVDALVLNSPWFDLAGGWITRRVLPPLVAGVARARPGLGLPVRDPGVYGRSLWAPAGDGGEWDFDVAWKSVQAPAISSGWITAVRRGQRRLHKGLHVGVPALVLHAAASHLGAKELREPARQADVVLDVADMERLAPRLGTEVTVVGIEGGLHDLVLSAPAVRQLALDTMTGWLEEVVPGPAGDPSGTDGAGSR